MRNLFILLLSVWALPTVALADADNLPERTIENVADGVIVTYNFSNPEIRPNYLFPGSYMWRYSGFGVCDISGKPAILHRSDMFYIPAGHTAQVTLLNATYRDTTLVMSPAIPNPPDNGSIVIDSITPYNGFYPNNVLKFGATQEYRGVGLQSVTVMPVKYNYNQHIVRAYSEIKYKVTFVQNNMRSASKRRSSGNMSDMTRTFLSNITLNYSPPNLRSDSTWHSTPNECNLAIFTTNEYDNAIQDFVKWKRMTGYNVYTFTKNKGDWTQENVIALADSCLDSLNVHYLLIVGGHDDIPGVPFTYKYMDIIYLVTANAVTDFEYGRPTETDSVPQISRGRIPADNAQQVTTILNKIIRYEKNPIIDEDFYHTCLNCAEFQDKGKDGDEDLGFVMTSENILEHVLKQGYQVHRQYVRTPNTNTPILYWSSLYGDGSALPDSLQPGSFAWNGNTDSIASYINNGVFYVLHRDHGDIDGWSHPAFMTSDVNQLQNGNKLPIVFSLNCLTGKYNYPGDCFAEAFLKKTDGGCAGIFAATEVSFSGYNGAMALGMFDTIWPNLQLTHKFNFYSGYSDTQTPIYELGQILDQGLIKMGSFTLQGMDYTMVTKKLFHCFGDPTMQIYTDTPQNFAEPLIYSRGDSIFVLTEDGDCNITFYNKASEEVKSYKGNYAAYANPSDSLVICLNRHNYVPYIWDYTKDIYIQNEDIQGETRVYTGNTIYVGNNVTSTKPAGDVNIQNSHVTIQGKRLELHPGTKIDKNFIFQNR
jgi:hypothetical protein